MPIAEPLWCTVGAQIFFEGVLDYLRYSGLTHAQYSGRSGILGILWCDPLPVHPSYNWSYCDYVLRWHYAFTIIAGMTLTKIRFWRLVTGAIWDILVDVSELKVLVLSNCDIRVHEWRYQTLRKEPAVCLSVLSFSRFLLCPPS